MAEEGSRRRASGVTAVDNALQIAREGDQRGLRAVGSALDTTSALRKELAAKGLKGFKKGGKVKKTGPAKLHKGERVLTKAQAAKPAVKRAIRSPASRLRGKRI